VHFRFQSRSLRRLYHRRPYRYPTRIQPYQNHLSHPSFRNPIRRQAALNRN